MSVTLFIFSRDRALQLDSLLRSVRDWCTGIDRIVVAFTTTTPMHTATYNMLMPTYPHVHFIRDDADRPLGQTLAAELLDVLDGYVSFAVDDMIYFKPSDFREAINRIVLTGAFVWSWRHGPVDYLWHTDGSLYRAADYLGLLNTYFPAWRNARTPNELEWEVASKRNKWLPLVGTHLRADPPTCMTWQINKHPAPVRGAPHFSVPDTEVDALARAYLAGRRVANRLLYDDQAWTTKFNRLAADQMSAHVHACAQSARFYASLVR